MQQQDRAKRRRATAAGVVIAGIGLLGIEAQAGVLIRRALAPTGVDADARGQTVVAINHNGGRGRLVVRGARLAPAPTFSTLRGGCCVVRNDEVECERTTVGECAAESGTKVDSCDPNPCAPSSPGVVRCCLPDVQGGGGSGSGRGGSGSGETETENEMECEQLTAD